MGGAHGDRAARMQALKTSVKTSFACISAPYLKMSGPGSANKQSLLYPV
jgi:hypothetical protein